VWIPIVKTAQPTKVEPTKWRKACTRFQVSRPYKGHTYRDEIYSIRVEAQLGILRAAARGANAVVTEQLREMKWSLPPDQRPDELITILDAVFILMEMKFVSMVA
jgi:hypothetical protein